MSKFAVLERDPESSSFVKEILPIGADNFIFNTYFRCDKGRCGAQAYVKTTFKSGLYLLWCAHHVRELEDKLSPLLSAWYSEENRLKESRHKGSEN